MDKAAGTGAPGGNVRELTEKDLGGMSCLMRANGVEVMPLKRTHIIPDLTKWRCSCRLCGE